MKGAKLNVIFLILFLQALFLAAENPPPFTFVAVGDNGCDCTPQRQVAERMIQWHQQKPFDTVVMLGDNVYPGHGLRGGNKQLFPDRFDKYYQPLLSQGVKFYAALGNHDAETNHGMDEIADKNRFHIMGDLGYYSFSPAKEIDGRPLITFFVLNSERLLKLNDDPAQIQWLSKALSESNAIWKVVYFHEPIYAPGGGHQPEGDLRQGIEKIMMAGGVQLVLAGHDHFYARLKPENGINYIISGGGGRDLVTPREGPVVSTVARKYHFTYFEVFPDQMTFQAVAASGEPLDHGMILPTNMATTASATPKTGE
jgi:3',5'-cyclic AMP phosphodiesterase CpdA